MPTKRRLRLVLAGMALLWLAACARSGFWDLYGLSIPLVECDEQSVFPGQRSIAVQFRLEHKSTQPLAIVEAGLHFRLDGALVDGDYLVSMGPANPTLLPGGGGVTLLAWVDVLQEARSGLVEIDASAGVRLLDGSVSRVAGAEQTASFEVVGEDVIIVTTADDEDDIGFTTPGIDSAGGGQDVSLREALLMANAADTPQLIRFDPEVFTSEPAVPIEIDPELGPLPAVTAPGTWLDGSDAGVVIAGSRLADGIGLEIVADDVTVQALTISGFKDGEDSHGLLSREVDRLRLDSCTFTDCGRWSYRAQVLVRGGNGHRIEDCVFQGSPHRGLHLAGSPSSTTILNCQINGNLGHGLVLSGSGHQVIGNSMADNGGSGVLAADTTGLVFRQNQSRNNGIDGIFLSEGCAGLLIEECQFTENVDDGVHIDQGASRVTVTRCLFEGNRDLQIETAAGANQGVEPPVIDSFDGGRVTGSSSSAGRLELYRYLSGKRLGYFEQYDLATAGALAVDLSDPQMAVALTVTNPDGSTSAFSEYRPLDQALLVTTVDDELDGGAELDSLDQAGWPHDLSLREAIVLANVGGGPNQISFDPLVFPPGNDTLILVGAGPAGHEPLPALTASATVIDGSGSGVVLDGGEGLYPEWTGLITITGDECQVRNLTLQRYNAESGAGVLAQDADVVEVTGCRINCAYATAGIKMSDTKQVVVSDNEIFNCGSGIVIPDYSANGVVERNWIHENSGTGIYTRNSLDFTILDNRVTDCAHGIRLYGHYSYGEDMRVIGNQVWSNAGNGVWVDDVDNTEVVFNTIVGNALGISVTADNPNLLLQNNLMAFNTDAGLKIADNHTGVWQESYNLFYDNQGDLDTGAHAYLDHDPTELDPTDLLADPVLADWESGQLEPAGAAIDAGLDVGYDRNGNLSGNFNGLAPDIGAIETN